MKKRMFLTIAVPALAVAASAAASFTGVITDTMCGVSHDMMKGHPADQCVRLCTKGQYTYALYDGTDVLKLSDQKTPAKFAARRVRVKGTLDQKNKTIKVSSIEPIDDK